MLGAAKWGFGIARYFLGYAYAVPRLVSSFPRQIGIAYQLSRQ
jgi:hypothetical protein